MEVKLQDSANSFLKEYEAVLTEQESVSQLVLYNAIQKQKSPEEAGGMFGAVLEDENPILLFCNVSPYNMAIYAVRQDHVLPATVALADFLGISHVTFTGINARNDICLSFMEQYKKHVSCSFSDKMGMDIMELREVNDITPMEGNHRLATTEEAKIVADWMIQFQMEAKTSEMDYEAALNKANRLIGEKKIYFYENSEQQVVSMAIAARELLHGVAITYVFTPEEYRGKGYAAANIYYLSKELLELGYEFCTLFVDKKNYLSNRAYEKVGFKTMEDNYEYKIIPAEV